LQRRSINSHNRIRYVSWSKSSRNSFRKFKIQFYSSKVILSPSKYFPSTATHLCQRLIQLSKHFWNSIVGIAIKAVFDFSIISFWLLKRVPRNVFWLEQKKIAGSHIRWIRLLDGIRFILGQKFTRCKFNSIFKTVKNRKYVQR